MGHSAGRKYMEKQTHCEQASGINADNRNHWITVISFYTIGLLTVCLLFQITEITG